MTRRINRLVELHERREQLGAELANYQLKKKSLFDKKAKGRPLYTGDLVLRWDVRREDKGMNEKFDPL